MTEPITVRSGRNQSIEKWPLDDVNGIRLLSRVRVAFNKAIRLARVSAFVVIFWLAGLPSFVATEKCPLNTNRRAISLVRDAEGISQSRQGKMCAHLLTEKTISRFASLAQSIAMIHSIVFFSSALRPGAISN